MRHPWQAEETDVPEMVMSVTIRALAIPGHRHGPSKITPLMKYEEGRHEKRRAMAELEFLKSIRLMSRSAPNYGSPLKKAGQRRGTRDNSGTEVTVLATQVEIEQIGERIERAYYLRRPRTQW